MLSVDKAERWLAVAFMAALSCACASIQRVPVVQLAPCTIEKVDSARCGRLSVPENHAKPSGAQIELNVVVVPAASEKPARDAIFVFQGGPGQAATTLAEFYARTYAAAGQTRDIVLVDQRGTGKSATLACEGSTSPDLFPLDVIKRCRAAHADHDLSQFTTAATVADAELVRKALGYDRINIYGTSYGTRVAMFYARTHPSHVRTLTLKGVVSDEMRVPERMSRYVERSLELTIADCALDAKCRTTFPNLRDEYTQVLRALDANPSIDGRELTRGRVGAAFRTLLQSPGGAAQIPALIHAAAAGQWKPIADNIMNIRKQAAASVSSGLMLSVLCSEDLPFANDTDIQREANNTLLGTYWRDQLVAGCDQWSVPAQRSVRALSPIQVPTLLISGNLDPATPPEAAEEAQRYLPRSRHVVVPYGSHSFGGLAGCVDRIMNDFLERADVSMIDDRCAAEIRRPPFRGTDSQ